MKNKLRVIFNNGELCMRHYHSTGAVMAPSTRVVEISLNEDQMVALNPLEIDSSGGVLIFETIQNIDFVEG